jgi:hydrogenase-4 component B
MPCIYGLLSVDVNFLHMGGRALLPMLFIVILAIYYTVAFMDSEIKNFIIYCGLLYICGFMLVVTSSTILMFVAFEGILIPTSIVLDKFSKTVRGRDATLSMILLTQVGAMLLFFIIIIVLGVLSTNTILDSAMPLSRSATNLIFILLLLGFGTKMPIWPFYYWLPEAHVEVSTNFSIILSGLSIKFAFLGFLKFISVFGCGDLYWLAIILCSFGSIDAALRMDTESDIKKIVAYQTVIEMQLLIIFTVIGCNEFLGLILFILQAHCWISTIEFIIVDIIMKRYHSRNLEQLYGIFAESPRIVKFIFFIVFILGSFPGTSIFSVEFLIQISFTTIPFNILLFIFLNFFTVI